MNETGSGNGTESTDRRVDRAAARRRSPRLRLGVPLIAALVTTLAAAAPEGGVSGLSTTTTSGSETASGGAAASEIAAAPEKRKTSSKKQGRPAHIQMQTSGRKPVTGDTLTVRVRLEHGAGVGSVPFHVTYDPRVLQFESGEEGSFLRQDGTETAFFASPMSEPGEIVVGISRLGTDPGANGAGDLCALRFKVIASGDAKLAFKRASVKDPRDKIIESSFETARVRVR